MNDVERALQGPMWCMCSMESIRGCVTLNLYVSRREINHRAERGGSSGPAPALQADWGLRLHLSDSPSDVKIHSRLTLDSDPTALPPK